MHYDWLNRTKSYFKLFYFVSVNTVINHNKHLHLVNVRSMFKGLNWTREKEDNFNRLRVKMNLLTPTLYDSSYIHFKENWIRELWKWKEIGCEPALHKDIFNRRHITSSISLENKVLKKKKSLQCNQWPLKWMIVLKYLSHFMVFRLNVMFLLAFLDFKYDVLLNLNIFHNAARRNNTIQTLI